MVKISLVIIIKDFFIIKDSENYKFYLRDVKKTKKKKIKKKQEFEISLELLADKFLK